MDIKPKTTATLRYSDKARMFNLEFQTWLKNNDGNSYFVVSIHDSGSLSGKCATLAKVNFRVSCDFLEQ